ncbi:MAG: hypothetical protein JWM47_3809 [Acidimicrobiales bacterium]|nr:hypothetical protein [Acidimicrobiales bacterium]
MTTVHQDADPRPQAVRQPASVVAGPEGHPVHPILVTIPIGAFVSSLIFDIGRELSDDPATFARGAAWLLVIGIVGAVLAALFGLLDYRQIPAGTKAKATATLHMGLNSVALVLFAVSAWGRFDRFEPPWETPTWCIVLSVAGLVVLGASGYLGGKLAYHFGVRVAGPRRMAEGYADVGADARPTTRSATD